MKHSTFDCYGANEHQLDDMKLINQVMTELAYELDLDPICPPSIIPYYYGKVKEDIGISAFVLLEGGHITIHTFPMRECYFLDCFTTGDFDENKIKDYLLEKLPYSEKKSFNETSMRNPVIAEKEYDPANDFGPHVMAEIAMNKNVNMEFMFDWLEKTAYDINMDPITRPCILKSSIRNPKYLSGIIIIAQSHISLHYEYVSNTLYMDIFSCMPFDYSVVNDVLNQLGLVKANELIARGTKHIYRVKSSVEKNELLANTKWQKIVQGKE